MSGVEGLLLAFAERVERAEPWLHKGNRASKWAKDLARDLREAAIAIAPAANDRGVNWRGLYEFQTAMRYMDNAPGLSRERAAAMAAEDVRRHEATAFDAAPSANNSSSEEK